MHDDMLQPRMVYTLIFGEGRRRRKKWEEEGATASQTYWVRECRCQVSITWPHQRDSSSTLEERGEADVAVVSVQRDGIVL